MWNYVYTDELYHWGVKGQKWGVRRYQNADGTLTAAGKLRESKQKYKEERKAEKEAMKAQKRDEAVSKLTETYKKKGYSDDVAKMKAEEQYVRKGEVATKRILTGTTIGGAAVVAAAMLPTVYLGVKLTRTLIYALGG